jgi:aspartyl-tRNA(Asn)/glutamyl-tRNA(Gln) amidotransferase subunit B
MEIVTEPDFRGKEDVLDYLKELQKIMRFVGASDADMEKGQLRCDVNISLRPEGSHELRNRVELKNLNSFQQIGRAIDAEVKRQIEIYDENGTVDQETRGWDDDAGESHSLRSKEDAMDYRYFPEPDLPPLVITQTYIDERKIAELPIDRRQKYLNEWKLLPDDARILSSERAMSDFFEKTVALTNEPKKSASLILTVILGILKKGDEEIDFSTLKITPEALARVVNMLKSDEISSTNAQEVVKTLLNEG